MYCGLDRELDAGRCACGEGNAETGGKLQDITLLNSGF